MASSIRWIIWLVTILVVAWPLHLLRPEIGDLAYVVACAVVLIGGYLLGRHIANRSRDSGGASL